MRMMNLPRNSIVDPALLGLSTPEWIRTTDTGFRKAVLYPLSYRRLVSRKRCVDCIVERAFSKMG